MIQTLDGQYIRPGDIVLAEYNPGYVSALIVGLQPGEYYFLPKEYQWDNLYRHKSVLCLARNIDEESMKFVTILGSIGTDFLPGYLSWLHGTSERAVINAKEG
jgi:hypothetical protein